MAVIIAVLFVAVLLSLLVFDKRPGKKHGGSVPAGYNATDEVIIDPVNGKKYRVYYNPDNGSRFYHEEA